MHMYCIKKRPITPVYFTEYGKTKQLVSIGNYDGNPYLVSPDIYPSNTKD